MEQFFGTLALITSLAISLGGLPAQIWRNYRLHSTHGVSPILIFASWSAYSSWLGYGIAKHDQIMIWSQVPGVVMTVILIGQFVYYRYRVLLSGEH